MWTLLPIFEFLDMDTALAVLSVSTASQSVPFELEAEIEQK